MKKIFLFSLCAFFGIAAEAREFICKGEASMFQTVNGNYLGESLDQIELKTNSVYGIYNSKNPSEPLALNRNHKKKPKNLPEGLVLVFDKKQKDDFGSSITTFVIPTGVFGAGPGKAFDALLITDERHALKCEIASW